MTLREVCDRHILNVLKQHNFNRTHTARSLEIGIRTLQRHLKRMGLQDTFTHSQIPQETVDTVQETVV